MKEYANAGDFRTIFTEDASNLRLLSLLLTADSEKAEKCFVTGLEDCANGSPVFLRWARSWAQRTITQNAIREMAPICDSADRPSRSVALEKSRAQLALSEEHRHFASILSLEIFERFVIVLSVLERYSDRECALLLGTSLPVIRETRMRALKQIADSNRTQGLSPDDFDDALLGFHLKTVGATE